MKTMKEFTILVFIFLCLFNFIVSDDCTISTISDFRRNSNTEGVTCKYNYPNSCKVCNGVGESDYYTFNGDSCSVECTGDKIIDGIKECTSANLMSSGLFYQLGDVYYTTDPSNGNTDAYIECSSSKVCKCKNYYHITYYSGKKIYNCFSNSDTGTLSSYRYYNYKTNEFFSSGCPDGFKITFQTTIGTESITRCSDKCLDNEYYNFNSATSEEFCTTTCSKGIYIVNGIKKCVNCRDVHLYNNDGNCVSLDKCSFYKDSTCYTTCGVAAISSYSYHNYGSKECIANCATTGEYIYDD